MTGKFRRDNLDSFTNYWDTNPIGAYAYESNFQRLDRVLELAGRQSGLAGTDCRGLHIGQQPPLPCDRGELADRGNRR